MGCAQTYANGDDACRSFDGRPVAELRLRAGTYHMFQSGPSDKYEPKLIEPNFIYTSCLYFGPGER
ncbi:hypothetical protein WEH80_29555 [Actinomycetes bacterium KLBMP 9759]